MSWQDAAEKLWEGHWINSGARHELADWIEAQQ